MAKMLQKATLHMFGFCTCRICWNSEKEKPRARQMLKKIGRAREKRSWKRSPDDA